MSRISVIIPGYNNGAFIAETIRTVLAQTVQPAEIIVIDDGSTDDTEQVVRSIPDSRIHYHRQANSGVSVARNYGLDRATGEFVSFLDADDRWRPHALETQHRLMQADPTLICCFGNFVRFENETGRVLPEQFTFYPELPQLDVTPTGEGAGFILNDDAFGAIIPFAEFPAYTQTMMFRASMVRDVRFDPRLIRCQDAHFVLRVLLRGKAAYTPEVIAEVRRHSGNATRDTGMMAVDQLRAIECVAEDPLVRSHQWAYDRRVTRARFDAAGALLRRKRRREALHYWGQALRGHGSISQKLKGTVRLAWVAAATSSFR
jgi:glycosyltransferase involved in cell wall biosynthesis